jgi:hypothetical protein
MSEQADSDSLRVEGSSKAKGTESIYQLLEVQTEVHHRPKGGGHEGGSGAAAKEQAERAVEDAIAEVKRLEGKLQRVQEQAGLVQKYTEGMLTSVGGAPVGTDLDIVSKLLDFHLQRLEQADLEQIDLKNALGQAQKTREAALATLRELQHQQRNSLMYVTSRDVTVHLQVTKVGDPISLDLTYMVIALLPLVYTSSVRINAVEILGCTFFSSFHLSEYDLRIHPPS